MKKWLWAGLFFTLITAGFIPAQTIQDPIVGTLHTVHPGTFTQGSPESEPCRVYTEDPIFIHTLTRKIAVMETEITRQMWADLKVGQPALPDDPTWEGYGEGMDHPVQGVTWYDCILFANLLSLQSGLTRCYYADETMTEPIDESNYEEDDIYCDFNADGYRLPFEGEWEYFCRAGTTGMFVVDEPNYNSASCDVDQCTPGRFPTLEAAAVFCANDSGETSPVGTKPANPWQLKNVMGNVSEWCWDKYGDYPYGGTATDYTGEDKGKWLQRVYRGGDWCIPASRLRSAARGHVVPDYSGSDTGFRLVRTLSCAAPIITLSTTELHTGCSEGSNASNLVFTVRNSGDGTLNYTIDHDADWLDCDPDEGMSTGEEDTITITFDTSSLDEGTYETTIEVEDDNAGNSPQTIDVTLDVIQLEPVTVWYNVEQTGSVYSGSASQVVPATYLTFQIEPNSFPFASPDNPAIIEIVLPEGAHLSQILATGTPGATSPLPTAGEKVSDLAVSHYSLKKGSPMPAAASSGKNFADIGEHAVQLFRYVAGEDFIWIRINESTTHWTPEIGDTFLGFTIGLGPGIWPDDESSNWGTAGYHRQQSTLFYLDLREFDFIGFEDSLPVELNGIYQVGGESTGTEFIPPQVVLFYVEELIEEEIPVSSQIGSVITDMVVVDLNRDGYDDVVTIDSATNQLYWTFGQADGSFEGLEWRDTVGISPQTIAAGDISGDARPDILIGDENGDLLIYLWEDLFSEKAVLTKVSDPSVVLKSPGQPSDSAMEDINNDGYNDYLYSDMTDDEVTVMFGNSFASTQTYATGASPAALSTGDFDGDSNPDVAVANRDGDSLTILINDGTGGFTVSEVSNVGQEPIAVDAADFDRDGLTDLAVALEGDQALSMLMAQAGGQFNAGQAKKLFFPNTPSALQAENFDGIGGPDILLGFSDFNKLAFCTLDESGNLIFPYTINTLGDVVVDPFNNVTLSEDSVLSVSGGTGAGGVSSRDGVAGIVQQSFNVLHFPRSMDISFSVVNLNNDNALLNLELYTDSGQYRTSTTEQISSRTQFARYFSALLGSEANRNDRWVRAFMTQSETYGLWLVNDGGSLAYLDGTRVPDIRSALLDFVLPMVVTDGGKTTSLVLINPNEESAGVVLKLYGQDGAEKATFSMLLKGRARMVLDAATVFPALINTDSIMVHSDRALVGFEIFGDSAAMACLEGIPSGGTHGFLYSPHMAVGDWGVLYESVLSLVNTSGVAAALRVSLYDDDGVQQGTVQDVDLPAHGKQNLDVATLFSLAGAATGYLKIDTDGASGIVGCITFGDAAAGQFVSCLPLQWEGNSDYLLGHIANGTLGSVAYFTGISVLNPEAVSREVEITAYNQFGVPLQSTTLTVDGNHRRVFLLDGLMPGLGGIFGGYIVVDGPVGAELMVFELFGNSPLVFLSAVPAVPLQ